jgi:iron complex outermembrane receptor protein
MNRVRIAAQKSLRVPGAPADFDCAWRPCRPDSVGAEARFGRWPGVASSLGALARIAPLVACAGVLTITLPVAAQGEPAAAPTQAPPAAEASPEAPPASPEPSSEAAPAAPAASGEAPPASAEANPEASTDEVDLAALENEGMAEVVVTSFRSSLGAALERKQNSTAQVDAIIAEDMAEFPDLNLAESLQRLPGISISRSQQGDANQITVRGLGGLYTRVRVNGMEARSSVGNNAGRNFDFNLFASELFNSIVVHKTASADLEEGSLGAVVDLNTARAFDYKKGFTFVVGATAAYNDLADTIRPRLTALAAYHDPDNVWGASASVAYSRVRLDAVSTDTVNWQKAPFRSVDGIACNPMVAMETDPTCLAVDGAFHPRIPRFGQDVVTGDRLGMTAGVQFRPADSTKLSLDALYATYPTVTDQRRFFPLIRNNEGSTDLFDYTLVAFPERFGTTNDSIVAGSLNNAQIRSEAVRLDSTARFYQLTLNLQHRFTDDFYLNAFAGTQRSRSGVGHDTTINYDNRAYDGYRFDFTDDEAPSLGFNGDVDLSDPANFVVPEVRDRVGKITGGFDTASLDLRYNVFDELKLAAGVNFKRATVNQKASLRDGTVCALGLYDCDLDDDGTNDPGVLGPPGDPARTTTVNYRGDVGPGSTTRWISPDIDDWVEYFDYYNAPLTVNLGGTYKVTEKNLGYFLQASGEVPVGSGEMRLLYDAGVRYVETRQTSSGYQGEVYANVDRPTYRDVLPSANAAFWFTNELVLRGAAARVMARPALGDLSPGAGVDSFAYTVNFQNPRLDPTRATSLDTALEWYFGEGSLLALAFFYKSIDSFPIRESRRDTFASTGLPRSVILATSPADMSGPEAEGNCGDPAGCWNVSQLTNGPGAKVRGLELAFQAPFNVFYGGLPPVLRDMGFIANYTFVDSSVRYDFFGNSIKERLTGLSKGAYNATLYYEDSIFSARASLAYRGGYLAGGPNSQGNLWTLQDPETRLDASTSYTLNEYLKFSLEGLNLLNTPFSQKVDIDAERRLLYNKTGRTFLLGARFTY